MTCQHGGKCKDHQCQCNDNYMGHDCSISKWISFRLFLFIWLLVRCGNGWCSQKGGKCKHKKHCQCLLRAGGPDCSGGML